MEVSDAQVAELEAHVTDIDFDAASAEERKCRHDVMAHVRTYAAACPRAAAIIHLGATSAYVTDNTVSVDTLVVLRSSFRSHRSYFIKSFTVPE